jgi:hypothetical protein
LNKTAAVQTSRLARGGFIEFMLTAIADMLAIKVLIFSTAAMATKSSRASQGVQAMKEKKGSFVFIN